MYFTINKSNFPRWNVTTISSLSKLSIVQTMFLGNTKQQAWNVSNTVPVLKSIKWKTSVPEHAIAADVLSTSWRIRVIFRFQSFQTFI